MIEEMDNQAATLKRLAKEAADAAKAGAREGAPQGRLDPVPGRAKVPHTVAISSGKGGVGKTLVTVNVAINLARQGLKVLVIDADLGLANIDVVLGLTPEFTIQDVLEGHKRLDQVALSGPLGITILPAASGVAELSNLSEEQRLLLMDQMDRWNANFDVVLVDTGAGISPNVRYFILAVEHILVVVTPDPASITDAYALMKVMFLNHRVSHFDLLVNQVKSRQEALEVYKTLHRVADQFLNVGLFFAGFIPHDTHLTKAVRQQKPVAELFPNAPASKAFLGLADNLVNRWENQRQESGRLTFFGRRGLGAGDETGGSGGG